MLTNVLELLKPAPRKHESRSICRQFCQDGYVLLPDMFSADEIALLRRASLDAVPSNSAPYAAQYSISALFTEPFRLIFKNKGLISAMRALFGDDFLFVNEFALHDSSFAGWHTDTSSPEGKGRHEFHWSPLFGVANIAIYLQAGSLDIVPKSHMRDDPLAPHFRDGSRVPPFAYRNSVTIPSKPGDVVIFHLRASHKASAFPIPPTASDRKLALFILAGPNNAMTRRYREWLEQYDKMNRTQRPEIPEEFMKFLDEQGMRII